MKFWHSRGENSRKKVERLDFLDHSHLNYHQVPFDTFTDDLLKGETVIK
ncbi:hypothetical protein R9C00_05155 [Flammeovirgaceae bacterium SG7u.111]|nr:hypothetical protein R9C00_05155 [Flammeovirgaceae bacterium SG7u.111]